MSYNNKFFLGCTAQGFTFLAPPRMGQVLSDDDAVELAALIISMKPHLQEKFEAAKKRIEEGA